MGISKNKDVGVSTCYARIVNPGTGNIQTVPVSLQAAEHCRQAEHSLQGIFNTCSIFRIRIAA
jgi:hypothetical protein